MKDPIISNKMMEHTVSEHWDKYEKLMSKIKYDPVTGIYTRFVLTDLIEKKLEESPNTDYDLVCLQVIGYHLLLERYGKDKCDKMRRNICNMIKQTLPEDSVFGMFSDSQIVFLTPSVIFSEHVRAAENTQSMVEHAAVNGAIVKCGVYQHVDRSLGAEKICHNAILAINTIKNQYGVFVVSYNSSIREKLSREQFIIENMDEAIKLQQFIVYYQPKIRLKDEKINGAEALVRWIHPEAGFMNPGEFISIFEHNGFIQELDRYMLESVCKDIRGWIDKGMNVVPVSVNVSQLNFDNSELAEDSLEIVDRYGVPHELIHFEITETTNASDFEKKIRNVVKLKEYGFGIELDDFGSGYSSLSSLCEMPIDTVKFDMSLCRKMFEKRHSAVLSGALFTARELALKVVAEGIETREQVDELAFRGAYIKDLSVQGYYYSKPLPKIQFESYLMPEDSAEGQNNLLEETISDKVESTVYKRSDISSANGQFENELAMQKYKSLMEVPGMVIYEYDPLSDKMILEIQRENDEVVRRTAENYLETLHTKHWIYHDDLQAYIDAIRTVVNYGHASQVIARGITRNGGFKKCKYSFAPIKNAAGAVVRVAGRAEALTVEEGNLEEASAGTFRYKNDASQKFEYISENVVRMLGYESERDLRTAFKDSFINFVYEEDRARVIREINDQIKDSDVDYCEYRVKKADGSLIWIYDKGTLMRDEFGNEFFYVTISDLDDFKSKEEHRQRGREVMKMKYKSESRQDKMTSLDNKDYSSKLISKYLQSKDHGSFFLVDIDDFKRINDTRGHVAGDRIVCEFADSLRRSFRDGDVLGRYGMDEFICYMPGINKRSVAERKAGDIVKRASKVNIGDNEYLSVSIGIVTDVLRAKDFDDLIEMAEKALNDTRQRGETNYSFY